MTSVATDRRFGVNAGAAVKVPVKAASTAALTLSGEQTVDGVALVDGDRCLVKNQSSGADNGIYEVDTGTWTRAPDWDGTYDVKKGTLVYVTSGTVNAGLLYVVTTSDPITIGTTSVAFGAVANNNTLTVPIPVTQGGTGGTSAISGLSSLGLIQVTAEGGTSTAMTGTIDALVTAYRADQIFIFVPSTTNTGATTLTLTPSGSGALAAKNIFADGAACVGGELVASTPVLLHYDGTQFNIVGAHFFRNDTQDTQPVRTTDFLYEYDASAKRYKRVLLDDLPLPRSYLAGYGMANNGSDATNDIDVAVGSCRSTGNTDNIILATALTKQLDAAWAVGTNQGMRASGAAITNTTYHIFVIKRPDTGVIDIAADTSATGANIAANTNAAYTEIRRIGSILREGGAIVAFDQKGDEFKRKASILSINQTAPGTTAVLRALGVPLGIKVKAMFNWTVDDPTTAAQYGVYFSDPDVTDEAVSATVAPLATGIDGIQVASDILGGYKECFTDTSAQVRSRCLTSDADTVLEMATLGWYDRRGRDD